MAFYANVCIRCDNCGKYEVLDCQPTWAAEKYTLTSPTKEAVEHGFYLIDGKWLCKDCMAAELTRWLADGGEITKYIPVYPAK